MNSMFHTKAKSGVAALASALAIGGLTVYVASPSYAKPATVGSYRAAATGVVSGTVESASGKPLRGAKVRLVFRDATGRVVEKVTVHVDARGHYSLPIPAGAQTLRVKTYNGQVDSPHRVTALFPIEPGKSLTLTSTFPVPGSGLVPGVFPY